MEEKRAKCFEYISKRIEKTRRKGKKKKMFSFCSEKKWKGKRRSREAEWIFSLGNVGTIVYLPTGGRERRLVRGDGRRARRVLLTRDRRQ